MDIREDLNIYMQIIRLLDESVNGYLYACDLQDDRMYFTDKICRRFALPFSGEQGIPFKEWEAVIYDRDVTLIKHDMEAVRPGKRNGCDIECRMIDRERHRVGVHWRATVHADKSGKPAVLLGSMDELVLGQRIDSLTGLWNYDKCTEDLESAVLKEEGYFIKCVFVLTVDPQINIARIESRVAAGGHNVDSSKVIERYYKSINNIKELLDICDIMHVYDNTKSPERIIRKHKEELSIYPNEYWSEQDILGLME